MAHRVHTRCLAVLETMWGGSGHAPGLYHINPQNFTGRRLYKLLGHTDLWCTNVCREYMAEPTQHGVPDPVWLVQNLKRIDYDLLLVCGRVAQNCYDQCGYKPNSRVVKIPHPASRSDWTAGFLKLCIKQIQGGIH